MLFSPVLVLIIIYVYYMYNMCCQMINRIQNKSFCLHHISVCTVYICYVYININAYICMYILKKNVIFIY